MSNGKILRRLPRSARVSVPPPTLRPIPGVEMDVGFVPAFIELSRLAVRQNGRRFLCTSHHGRIVLALHRDGYICCGVAAELVEHRHDDEHHHEAAPLPKLAGDDLADFAT
ncbi:MAG: hypothetical protein U0804_17090 [Gemmataceae bacterium]